MPVSAITLNSINKPMGKIKIRGEEKYDKDFSKAVFVNKELYEFYDLFYDILDAHQMKSLLYIYH